MIEDKKEKVSISIQALKRLPYYLQYLVDAKENGMTSITATAIASDMKLNEVQVRKDLAAMCTTKGKPKAGFKIDELIANMEDYLGYNNTVEAVLVGAGSLGTALISYRGFRDYGVSITAAFDSNEALIGKSIAGVKVLPVDKLSEMCRRMNIHIGIITVPASEAQVVCDQLVAGGVLSIWNFAPKHLSVPDYILVHNENMAASLAMLSQHLEKKISEKSKLGETK